MSVEGGNWCLYGMCWWVSGWWACEQFSLFQKPHLEALLVVIKHLIMSSVWWVDSGAVRYHKTLCVLGLVGVPWHSRGCSLSSSALAVLLYGLPMVWGHLTPGPPRGFHHGSPWFCPVCYVWLLIHRQKPWVIVFALLLLLGFQCFHHVLDPLLELHLGLSS